jgi:hypothetical protein
VIAFCSRKKRERESMSDPNDSTSTDDEVPVSLTRTTKPTSCPTVPEDEESAEIEVSSATAAVKRGGLRANGFKKLETMLKNREKNRKEKQQRTKDWMDGMNAFMVERNKRLDPELVMKRVKEVFEDRAVETDSWRVDYDAECARINLELSQQEGNGL